MELEEAASQNLTSSLWLLGNATDDSSNQLMMNCSLAQNGTEAFEHCQESAGKLLKPKNIYSTHFSILSEKSNFEISCNFKLFIKIS